MAGFPLMLLPEAARLSAQAEATNPLLGVLLMLPFRGLGRVCVVPECESWTKCSPNTPPTVTCLGTKDRVTGRCGLGVGPPLTRGGGPVAGPRESRALRVWSLSHRHFSSAEGGWAEPGSRVQKSS